MCLKTWSGAQGRVSTLSRKVGACTFCVERVPCWPLSPSHLELAYRRSLSAICMWTWRGQLPEGSTQEREQKVQERGGAECAQGAAGIPTPGVLVMPSSRHLLGNIVFNPLTTLRGR